MKKALECVRKSSNLRDIIYGRPLSLKLSHDVQQSPGSPRQMHRSRFTNFKILLCILVLPGNLTVKNSTRRENCESRDMRISVLAMPVIVGAPCKLKSFLRHQVVVLRAEAVNLFQD